MQAGQSPQCWGRTPAHNSPILHRYEFSTRPRSSGAGFCQAPGQEMAAQSMNAASQDGLRRGAQGGEDGVVWRGGALGGRGRADAARADAQRGELQPAVAAHGAGPLSRLCGPACPGPGASQPAAQRVARHALPRCRCRPAGSPPLRQRSAHGHPVVPAARHAAAAGGVHAAVSRPAGAHAAPGARDHGVRARGGQGARTAHPRSARIAAGRHRGSWPASISCGPWPGPCRSS